MHICFHYLQRVHFVDTYRKSCNIFCKVNKDLEKINYNTSNCTGGYFEEDGRLRGN